MDWQAAGLVSEHVWLQNLLESDRSRHRPVPCGRVGHDFRYLWSGDYAPRAGPRCSGWTTGRASDSPDLTRQSRVRRGAANRIFYSPPKTIRDVVGSSGERRVSWTLSFAVRH